MGSLKVVVRAYLSPVGRKASLLAGGTGERELYIDVPPDHPCYRDVVELGVIEGNQLVLVARPNLDSTYMTWNHVPTVEEVVGIVRQVLAREAEEVAAKAVAIQDCIANRHVVTKQVSMYGVDMEVQKPEVHVPHGFSPEGDAWLDELEAAYEAKKQSAHEQYTREWEAKKAAAQAEYEARRASEEAALKAQREAAGLAEGEDDYQLEHGALVEAPRWSNDKRARNWLARITPDPKSSGGFAREFADKAKGKYLYIWPTGWVAGDHIEFGADVVSYGGKRKTNRWRGTIVRIEEGRIVLKADATD